VVFLSRIGEKSGPPEHRLMERAVDLDFDVYQRLHCCSAEDLTILKTVAGRPKDWVDFNRIIQRSGQSGRHVKEDISAIEVSPDE
jgi:hypothetical protein